MKKQKTIILDEGLIKNTLEKESRNFSFIINNILIKYYRRLKK